MFPVLFPLFIFWCSIPVPRVGSQDLPFPGGFSSNVTEFSSEPRLKREVRSLVEGLSLDPQCKGLRQICPALKASSDNLDVVICVLKDQFNNPDTLEDGCRQKVRSFSSSLLTATELKKITSSFCMNDLTSWGCTKEGMSTGDIYRCLFDTTDRVTSKRCLNFIERLKYLTFLDLRAMSFLLVNCGGDIDDVKCKSLGTLEDEWTDPNHGTLTCLQENISKIKLGKCKDDVMYLSKIQAENVIYDRDLYFNCAHERMTYCRDVPLGGGKMYKCLMEHKLEGISQECYDNLLRHEQLIVHDYQVSRGLVRVCREDIRAHHCRKSVSDDRDIRLAQILLCLENASRNGTRVSKDCALEMLAHRKLLMESYKLSPELVTRCSEDIDKFCKGLEEGGRTIHCLMEHARLRKKKDRISYICQRELEYLVKEADVGEDWRVDPIIRTACRSVVQMACKDVKGGNSMVMSCLMERIGTNLMDDECETALLQIQYFVARDYKLDAKLYKNCREDAVTKCHAKKSWEDGPGSTDPDRGVLVLPCLYRFTLPNSKTLLRKQCYDEVLRVMRQRALSVQLEPEIEVACIDSLASICNEKTGPGEEILCLQDNMNSLDPKCKAVVSNFTEIQSAHMELNPIILTNCHDILSTFCQNDVIVGDGEDIMKCLITHKNDVAMKANPKCRAAVEHHQLISLKTFHFTFKFKEACRSHVSRYCPNAKTKSQVVTCLSEVIRNDTLDDQRHRIPKECRQQVRFQLLQQRESIDLNPELKKACSQDITKFCPNVEHGNARVLECLETKKVNLSSSCHQRIFNIEKQDLSDSSTDYTLINSCRMMILKYCRTVDSKNTLDCLKRFKYEADFDKTCRMIVVRRMIEQNTDYRLNLGLQRECKQDILKFCWATIARDDSQVEGKVIRCLKGKFRERRLSLHCEQQLSLILKEAALNYHLNPLLTSLCTSEIKQFCGEDLAKDDDGQGKVEECLKRALLNGMISNRACRIEVVELIKEGKADIQTDPLLYRACALDIQSHCSEIEKGDSRQLDCMLAVLKNEEKAKTLQMDCRTMLRQRVEMYKIEPEKLVENLGELYSQVTKSPSKRYFVVMALSFIGMIFISGLFCGRAMRRSVMVKNK